MATAIRPEPTVQTERITTPPIHLKTWKEVREYYAAHLTPVRHSSNGRPIYSNDDIKKLNILLPDEK